MKFRVSPLRVPLGAPFVSSASVVEIRELLLIELEDQDGVVGHGEAAPLESYDGVSIQAARQALEDCRPVLEGASGAEHADLLAACAEAAVLPQAVAGVDLALWDLAGKRAGRPVWQLLGGEDPAPIEVNATIASADRAGAAREAHAAAQAGFRCIKVKVGLGDDAGRLAAVRAAAGPEMAIRLDANGAWSVDEAVASLRALAPVGLELCEEPAHGLEENRAVAAAAPVRVAIDESSALPGALQDRVCQAVCLKISRCGGISGLLTAAAAARTRGYEVYLASTLDGPLGIAAALHAAAAIAPDRPCGLVTLPQFAAQHDPLPARDGRLAAPVGRGLGDRLVDWYRPS